MCSLDNTPRSGAFGETVGDTVGDALGVIVGLTEGDDVGVAVGVTEGEAVGVTVGVAEGNPVGEAEISGVEEPAGAGLSGNELTGSEVSSAGPSGATEGPASAESEGMEEISCTEEETSCGEEASSIPCAGNRPAVTSSEPERSNAAVRRRNGDFFISFTVIFAPFSSCGIG